MVNFRYHLVSLTAVFLALAMGIGLGAALVDEATVDVLERRLDGVEERVRRTDGENQRLAQELGRWDKFSEEASAEAVAGRLSGMPVLVVAVQGVDRGPVDDLRQSLTASGATFQGTVWLTSKFKLDKPEDNVALANVLGLPSSTPETVRRTAVARLAQRLARPDPTGLLAALRDGAFVDFDAPTGDPGQLAALPLPETRFVVVSAGGAVVPNQDVALPLVGELARQTGGRVLAAEPGREPQAPNEAGQRAVFVGPLREDGAVAGLVPTVDNLEDFRGRFAAVYALRDLARGKVGHFGVGPRASRLVPETAA